MNSCRRWIESLRRAASASLWLITLLALVSGVALAEDKPAPAQPETSAPAAATPAPAPGKDYIFDSAGVKIHYKVYGKEDGVPVLLIHGFTANIGLQWDAPGVIKGLADTYHIVAIDNRGHGSSGKPHEADAYGLNMVEDQIRLLDHLNIKKAHIVGYSMGGFITMRFLLSHPDRCLSATLGGAGWAKENDERMDFIEELATSLEEGRGMGPLIRRLTPAGEEPPTDEKLKSMNAMVTGMNDTKALAACIRGMRKIAATEDQIKANKVPSLALIGEIDPLKEGVDRLVGVMPNLEIVVIPKANHMTAFGNPLFINSLKDFLAKHSPANGAK